MKVNLKFSLIIFTEHGSPKSTHELVAVMLSKAEVFFAVKRKIKVFSAAKLG